MGRHLALAIFLTFAALFAFGCADPAADKPKATVGGAAPEAPKTAGAETLTIRRKTRRWTSASKVTRSHEGSFKQFSGKIELHPNTTFPKAASPSTSIHFSRGRRPETNRASEDTGFL